MHQSKQTFESNSEHISEGMKVHTHSLLLEYTPLLLTAMDRDYADYAIHAENTLCA